MTLRLSKPTAGALALAVALLFLSQPVLVACASGSGGGVPTVTILSPAEGATIRGHYVVETVASDGASVELSDDGGVTWSEAALAPSPVRWHRSTYSTPDGPVRILARAIDAEGRTATASVNVTLETLPISLWIDSPAEGSRHTGEIVMQGRAQDPNCDDPCWSGELEWTLHPSAGWVSLDLDTAGYSSAIAPGEWEFPIDMSRRADGPVTVHVRIRHGLPPPTGLSRTFELDNRPPFAPYTPSTIVVDAPSPDARVSGSIALRGHIVDPSTSWVGPVEVSEDGGASWKPAVGGRNWSYELDTRAHGNGPLLVWLRAADLTQDTSVGHWLEIANPLPPEPIVGIDTPTPWTVVSGPFDATGIAIEGSNGRILRVELRLSDRAWEPAAGTSSWRARVDVEGLPEGRHDLQVRAYDGFTLSSIASIPIRVEHPPAATGAGSAGVTTTSNESIAAADGVDQDATSAPPVVVMTSSEGSFEAESPGASSAPSARDLGERREAMWSVQRSPPRVTDAEVDRASEAPVEPASVAADETEAPSAAVGDSCVSGASTVPLANAPLAAPANARDRAGRPRRTRVAPG